MKSRRKEVNIKLVGLGVRVKKWRMTGVLVLLVTAIAGTYLLETSEFERLRLDLGGENNKSISQAVMLATKVNDGETKNYLIGFEGLFKGAVLGTKTTRDEEEINRWLLSRWEGFFEAHPTSIPPLLHQAMLWQKLGMKLEAEEAAKILMELDANNNEWVNWVDGWTKTLKE